ncbi:hypothetical protein TNCV_4254051 [Trichonephila clavipes]|nr:hypothetical protein TNCV_4254051 [Trichonephila clavipes]
MLQTSTSVKGHCTPTTPNMRTDDHRSERLPIANRPYRTFTKDEVDVKKQLDALLQAGIIKPSRSSYAAPIALAFKKEDNAHPQLYVE